jgi:hypothetical protein
MPRPSFKRQAFARFSSPPIQFAISVKFTLKLPVVAVIVKVPLSEGSVYIVLASPWLLVVELAEEKLPPAPLSEKFTVAFGTALPY